jgi:hypothetical protein
MGVTNRWLGICGAALMTLVSTAAELSAAPALPPPSPSPPVFEPKPYGPLPAPTPPRPSVVRNDPPRPLPRKWIIGAAAFGAVAGGALLFFGVRAWRMSRLFGRQYRFAVRENVPLRLGGERSGGLLASASFADATSRAPRTASKPKDT